MLTAQTKTRGGKSRYVGFEIEYAGVPLWRTAKIIQALYGGDIIEHTKAEWSVEETLLGTFRLEIDAAPIKRIIAGIHENDTLDDGVLNQLFHKTANSAEDAVTFLGSKIAPMEIIAPPVLIDEIPELDKLRAALFYENAEDTQSSLHHAFGLHINPDAIAFDAASILRHIQAFALLYPWLKEAHNVDITRRLTPFIAPYSQEYMKCILAEEYQPDLEELIRDYHHYNTSRNKALDLLPLFAFLKEKLVRSLYGSEEKIHARPTYHYRLPNSEISRGDWSLMVEWGRWLAVEQLASNEDQLNKLQQAWRETDPNWFTELMEEDASWSQLINKIMRRKYA
ncbi:amidoligase family protein [Kordiimonas pumila]|uniref:Amidoligase family protein n=1 Tax=Kordiimonas pumila TaxID=2161677 RepID=A0ABV7D427_9PROT|nr:amidoligase family protein [Kordiimonas pumila]